MKSQLVAQRAMLSLGASILVYLSSVGCGPPEARTPNPLRSVDEGRALKLIARAFSAEGIQPTPPRWVSLSGNTKVRLDVGAEGRKLGVVYLTATDVHELGDNPLAKRSSTGSELIVRAGEGPDDGLRAVILYASDYVYDDNVGDDREASAITAENKLDRDVRDFIVIARKNHWP